MTKLREFFNEVSNDNRIFTAEDVGEMPLEEFRDNEKAIFHQMANLGVPRRYQLAGNDDVIYVHAYTRADGTQVKAHYRSKHENLTGAAANANNSELTQQEKVLRELSKLAKYKMPTVSTGLLWIIIILNTGWKKVCLIV